MYTVSTALGGLDNPSVELYIHIVDEFFLLLGFLEFSTAACLEVVDSAWLSIFLLAFVIA